MTTEKMIYGIADDTIYVASGAAILRAIASNAIQSDSTFTMGQLKSWFNADMADSLVLQDEDNEGLEGALSRPINDETMLTSDNINQDAVEDYGWIEHAMFEELPRSVLALGAPPSYRGGLGLRASQLAEFERLMKEEEFELVRDDHLIGLIVPMELTVEQVELAAERIRSLT